jgi:hypothetical protein
MCWPGLRAAQENPYACMGPHCGRDDHVPPSLSCHRGNDERGDARLPGARHGRHVGHPEGLDAGNSARHDHSPSADSGDHGLLIPSPASWGTAALASGRRHGAHRRLPRGHRQALAWLLGRAERQGGAGTLAAAALMCRASVWHPSSRDRRTASRGPAEKTCNDPTRRPSL